jgi:hypothetical protein
VRGRGDDGKLIEGAFVVSIETRDGNPGVLFQAPGNTHTHEVPTFIRAGEASAVRDLLQSRAPDRR